MVLGNNTHKNIMCKELFVICVCCFADFTMSDINPPDKFLTCQNGSNCTIYKYCPYFKCGRCVEDCQDQCVYPDPRRLSIFKQFLELYRRPGSQISVHQKLINLFTDEMDGPSVLAMGLECGLTDLNDICKG